MWQMPCPTQEQSVLGVSRVSLSTQDRGPLDPSSPSVPSPADTLEDTDFVEWVL